MFLLSIIALTGASTAIEPSQVHWNTTPSLPGEGILEDFMGKVDGVLDDVVKANITGTNIYYYNNTFGPSNRTRNTFVAPTTNSTTFHLNGTDPSTSLLMVSYLNHLNGNLSVLIQNIANSTTLTVSSFSAWKNTIAKEWFGINATYGGVTINQGNLNTFVANIDSVHPLIPAPFSSMTPEEIMIATRAMIKPRDSFDNLWRAYYVDNNCDNITDFTIGQVLAWAAPFVSAANTEIATKTSITLNYTLALDVHETLNAEDMVVVMLWDHDDSLPGYIRAKKAHPLQNPGFKPFSGDEVFYIMHFHRITTSVWGSIQKTSSWRYNDGSPPTALGTLVRKFTATPYLASLLGTATGDAKAALLRYLLFGNVSISVPAITPRTFVDASFSFAQLKVNALDLEFSWSEGLQVNKLDLWYGEHKFAGLFAYEDVNGNGIQDISIQGNAPFLYPVSTEARYRLRIDNATGRTLVNPVVTSNGLDFGINFTGITGKLVPIDQSDDAIMLNSTVASSIPVNIDAIGFMFRFTADVAAKKGNLKVDYNIGAFKNATGIEPATNGLSLSMVSVGAMFRVLAGTRRVSNTVISNENGTTASTGSNATSRVAKIRFGSGTSLSSRVFESDLSSIPYTIGTTAYTATGQIIPVLMGGIALGKSNQVGNFTQQSGVAIIGGIYLYSVNFPTWNGQALVHDPVFSTFITSAAVGPGIWVYIGISLGGIAALVVILLVVRAKKKHASSYPGMPLAAPGEAKASSGVPRVDLLHSLFFHFSVPDAHDENITLQIDPFDESTFEFFAALISIRVQQFHPAASSWATISFRDIESVPGVASADLAQAIDSGTIASPDKYALDTGSGRAYMYHVLLHNGIVIDLLDFFTRPSAEAIIRVSLCSRSSLTPRAYPFIENALNQLSMALKNAAGGKINKDKLDSILDEYLPVHLAFPRRLATNEVSGFLREVRHDGTLSPAEQAEIESDLREMDDATALRVSSSYKASSERKEMDAGTPDEPGR